MKRNMRLDTEYNYKMKLIPYNQGEYCGDDGIIIKKDQFIRACLFDGLGHGKEAHIASHKAVEYIREYEHEELIDLVHAVHETLRGTRGCAGAFCQINLSNGEIEFVGIGNITARINTYKSIRMVSRDGVLGLGNIRPKQHFYQVHTGECLIMYSDGVKEYFDFEECRSIFDQSAEEICNDILKRYGKDTDDQSCLVIKY